MALSDDICGVAVMNNDFKMKNTWMNDQPLIVKGILQ